MTDDIIKAANVFRNINRKRKLSCVDCLGYTLARSLGVPFLTGDQLFGNLDNVEFVK